MIVTKEDVEGSEHVEDIIYDKVLGEFPDKELEKEVIEGGLTHPAGISTSYDVEESLETRVHEWFEDNVTDYDVEAREKVANKFYNKIHERVDENYSRCKQKLEEEFDNPDELKLSTIREEVMSPIID